MYSFKEFFQETISIDAIKKFPGKEKIAVFMGRFQPPTKAHLDIIKKIQSQEHLPVEIAIVRGEKTGLNKEKNPFDFNLQQQIFKSCLGNSINIMKLTSGFIGEFINVLRHHNKEPVLLYCGTDRIKSYQAQISRYKNKLNLSLQVKEISRSDEDISASKVRNALKNNDIEKFKQLTDKCEWKYFEKLKGEIK